MTVSQIWPYVTKAITLPTACTKLYCNILGRSVAGGAKVFNIIIYIFMIFDFIVLYVYIKDMIWLLFKDKHSLRMFMCSETGSFENPKVAKRDQVIFSIPRKYLETARINLAEVVAPHTDTEKQPSLVHGEMKRCVFDDDDTHNMWLVPTGPVVDQLGGKDDSKSDHLFGSVSDYVSPDCFTETSFFKISSGNMRRHVISGESLKPFDFLAQRYFPVDGDDTFVNLLPCGSPFAISFQGVDFATLVDNIFVWKLDAGIAFVHNVLMNLVLHCLDTFHLVKFSWVRISSNAVFLL